MNNIYLFFCIKENLYIKRRNQLIGKIARKDCHEFRKQYFALRCQILNSKYGISYDQMWEKTNKSWNIFELFSNYLEA